MDHCVVIIEEFPEFLLMLASSKPYGDLYTEQQKKRHTT